MADSSSSHDCGVRCHRKNGGKKTMTRNSHRLFATVIVTLCPGVVPSQLVATIEGVSGSHPFAFKDTYASVYSQPLGEIIVNHALITYSVTTSSGIVSRPATLSLFSNLQNSTNSPATLTGG